MRHYYSKRRLIILVPNDCESMKPRVQALSTRAYENMCGVAMANPNGKNAGHSCAFSPICWNENGECIDNTLLLADEETEGLFYANFDMEQLRSYREREMLGNTFRKVNAYAVWHRYTLYTFIFNRNDGNVHDAGLKRAQKVNGNEEMTPDYYVGTYQGLADADFYPALNNSPLGQWVFSIYENQITDDMFFTSGGNKYLKLKNGMPTATGYRFKGWKVVDYSTETAETADVTVTYDDVTYGYKSNQGTHGIYNGDLDKNYDRLFIITALYDMQRMVKFDINVPANEVDNVTNFTPASLLYQTTGNSANDWSYRKDMDERKAINYTKPARPKYNFRGWSLNADTKPGSSEILSDTSTNYVGVNSSTCTHPVYDSEKQGYFYTQLYAVWEPLNTYTFIYQVNRPGLKQDDYPQGHYLGKEDTRLTDAMWNRDKGEWTEVLDEDDIKNSENYFSSGTSSYLRMKNGMLQSDHYIFRGWDVKAYALKPDGTETDEDKVLDLTETETAFPGHYELTETKELNVSDVTSNVGLYSGWFKTSSNTVKPPTVVYLKARWEPRRTFVLKYNKNLGGDGKPTSGNYITHIDEPANDGLSALPVNEDGEWEDVLEEEGISSNFVEGYYPLKHNRLQAAGYRFVGWDMYYYRKANNEDGKRLSGPYRYRFNSDGTFSKGYGIYGTWFNRNDAVDMEFDLYAVWEPQFEVHFNPGTTDTVTNMPYADNNHFSSLVKYKNWRGTGTKVFRASAPKRTGYYFVG